MTSTLEKPNIPMENMFKRQDPSDYMVRRWQSVFDSLFVLLQALADTESDQQIMFSDNGKIAGSTSFKWDDTNKTLTITAADGQESNLVEIKNSSGTNVFQIWRGGHVSNLAGMNTEAAEFGTGMLLHNFGEFAADHTDIVGSYDHTGGTQENLFTSTAGSDFTQSDVDEGKWLISLDNTANIGATAEIKEFIDANNVIVDGMNWTSDIASQTWAIFPHPVFICGDGNKIEFSVGATGEFEIHSYSFTGSRMVEIELDAAADDVDALILEVNANGYTAVTPQDNIYTSGDLQPGDVGSCYIGSIDETAATSADTTTLIASFAARTTDVSDATKTAFIALPGFTNAMVVQGAEAVDPDYGYENTLGNITDRVNGTPQAGTAFLDSSTSNLELFDNDDDYILIGSDATFEDISVSLINGSSKNIIPAFFYSKAGGSWTSLTVQGDGTTGFLTSGNIIFNAPGDWAKDDEDMDGNAITDAYYVAIQRTRAPAIVTLPTEGFFKTFASQDTGMSIDGKGYVKPRTAADASAPNNSIYYSTNSSKLVYKDSGGIVNDLY